MKKLLILLFMTSLSFSALACSTPDCEKDCSEKKSTVSEVDKTR